MNSLPTIFDDLELGIVVHDPETAAFLSANDTLQEMYGYSFAELREMSIGELSADSFTDSEGFARVRAAAAGDPQEFEWQIQRGSGELLWIRVKLVGTTVDGREYVIGHVEDITDYKVRESRLKLLQRVTRHNLRTQVQIIQGMTSQALTRVESSAIKDDLRSIKTATADLLGLTDTVNTLKAITDRAKSGRQPVQLESLVTEVLADYKREYPEISWTSNCDDGLWVAADDGLRIAFKEAIQNTVDHNDPADLQVRVTVCQSSENGHATIRIEDNGQRIPEIETDAVAVDHDPGQIGHGGGAGIWAMNAIVETLGGRFSIRYNEEFGNELEFSLPQTERSAAG